MDLRELIRKGEHEIKPLLHYFRGDSINLFISVLKADEKLVKSITEYQSWQHNVLHFIDENCHEKRNEVNGLFKSLQDNDYNYSDFNRILDFLRSFNDVIKKEITIQDINNQTSVENTVPKVLIGYGSSAQEKGVIKELEQYIRQLGFYAIDPKDLKFDGSKSHQIMFWQILENVDFAIFVFMGSSEPPRFLIMELGFLFTKLGPERVCVLVDEDFKMPFDISNIKYLQINKNNIWLLKVAKYMKNVGFDVDLNKLLE